MPIGAAGAAALGAAAIGAAGSIAGGMLQSNAVSGASKASIDQARQAAQLATQGYSPYIDIGKSALNQQNFLMGLSGPEAADAAMGLYRASPSYTYELGEGLKAVDAGAASKGMLRSGATLKAEQTLGSNLASLDFGNYYNRLNQLTQLGVGGTQGVVNAALGQSNNIQQTLTSAGGAQANILGSTVGNLNNSLGLANRSGLFDKLFGNSGSVYGTSGYGTGPGGTNSAGADVLQSLGFYNPLV